MGGIKRHGICLSVKLAACLLEILRLKGKPIDMARAKTMSAQEIISLFDFNHIVLHANGGPADPWNLEPLLRAEHRERTARIDIPAAAKARRIESKHQAFREQILRKTLPSNEGEKPKRPWPKRSFGGKTK
jgi:hypothetical protein